MYTSRTKQRGITLMELLTVMVIVGLLSAIAVPAYSQYMIRTRRSDALVALSNWAQQIERCYSTTNDYSGCGATPPAVPNQDYTLTFTPDATTPLTAYGIKAAPAGAQLRDSKCGTFGTDQLGGHTVTGTGPAAECWSGR